MAYCSRADVLRVSGISSTDLDEDDTTDDIADAEAYINDWTGKRWESALAVTEYFSGRAEQISATDSVKIGQFYSETEEDKYDIILSNYPVTSIDEFIFLDDDGTQDGDALVENTDYHLWSDTGIIRLITSAIPVGKGKKKVKITYYYGTESVPRNVRELTATIVAIKALVRLTGGSYNDITSYRLGPKEVGVGEPYMNMKAAIRELEKRRKDILNSLGRKFRTVVI